MEQDARIAGVGMVPFTKAGRSAPTTRWARTPPPRQALAPAST